MKKLLAAAIFLFVIASAFGRDKIEIKVFETSNDFAEIREVFQKKLYDASSEFKYFYHLVVSPFPFDVDILVNKEDLKAVVFNYNNEGFERAKPCSQAEIDKALALYPDL